MPIWRDPLDELIADLERTMPPAAATFDMPPVEDVILMVESALSDDPEKQRLLADDPRVKRAWEYYQRLPTTWQSPKPGEPDA